MLTVNNTSSVPENYTRVYFSGYKEDDYSITFYTDDKFTTGFVINKNI